MVKKPTFMRPSILLSDRKFEMLEMQPRRKAAAIDIVEDVKRLDLAERKTQTESLNGSKGS